jgi:predicted metal-dependent phosphoesterase TrpH
MRRGLGPLLCELHSHTRWSDGELTVAELVDLHGRSGFDVLCITDHVVRSDDPWRLEEGLHFSAIEEETFPLYLAEIEREAARAWRTYGLLVVPGLELTFNDVKPVMAAHAVAIGLREFVSVDGGIAEAMKSAAKAGAALIAAHPNSAQDRGSASAESPVARTERSRSPLTDNAAREAGAVRGRLTKRFSRDAGLRALADRFELFNRTQLFGWVAEAGLPAVASGDFHTPAHLSGWKTILPSRHDEQGVVEYLRSPRPVYLARLDDELRVAA